LTRNIPNSAYFAHETLCGEILFSVLGCGFAALDLCSKYRFSCGSARMIGAIDARMADAAFVL
jgi:hypothetical protein